LIRIGIQPKMLDPDPDPDEMNADPQPWQELPEGGGSAMQSLLMVHIP
jgi:hypothetical protein